MSNPTAHRARKRFGQNFLQDPIIIRRILDCIAPRPGERIVEIGPGQGAITRGLLAAAGELDVVELDRDLIRPLTHACADLGELRVHNADALKFDFCSLENGTNPIRVVGNLPYNISTPLLFHLLAQAHCIHDMHFMLQREVVARMAAEPGGKTYGRLSVMLQIQCEVEPLFTIGPKAFRPAPKVESGFVRLRPRQGLVAEIEDLTLFSELVTKAFSQRRKTLRNGLRGLVEPELMEAHQIDPGARAEQLQPSDFVALANAACKNSPETKC